MRRFILFYILLSYWAYALPTGIEEAIKKSGIPKEDISICIKEAGSSGNIIASLNENQTRTPASVIKVLTTYAAILKLGFDYRWPTRFYTTGSLDGGVLQGDLVIKGLGDPTLSDKDIESIVRNIYIYGIHKIKGNIIIDRTYFKVDTKDSSGFDENLYSPYNAMPDAMMFNERVSTICVTPNKNSVTKKTVDYSYKVLNKLQQVNKPCRGRYSWPGVKIDKSQIMPVVLLKGKISKRCGRRNICKVVTKPYRSFYYALKDKLEKEGIEVEGTLRLQKVPSYAKELFAHYAVPLEEIVSKTAKKSNNLYARHLLLLLGAKQYGAPSTLDKGRRAVEYILRSKGALGFGELKIDNGSGLSRQAKITAKLLTGMFDNAYMRYGQRWMNTLSVAGVNGTIKKRFRGTPVKNRAWMKTGTLKRVKNIGGYVKSRSGKLYTAVILVNTKKGNWRASQLQNDIIKWLVVHKGIDAETSTETNTLWDIKTRQPSAYETSSLRRYYVQAGSFSKQPDKSYLLGIERMGLRYRVTCTTNYKVLIGAYVQEKDARQALKKVREYINPGAFIVKM
ncbi:D-alanyl-D-alanine carboxypeptidase/D-alanyl-D-alanine-endopeptidase [Sulfurovum sp.]|uniref:D-alanyl-D-alanine carboxypeptidase/D-alanyl-D-alanine endopeptidase n=1 Tax=Sulfurovum sp. TaxID=1969726 RepID=UPI0025D20444|nr:D-alanyl-D-alanine carboxypeptidase/D-alanyl-D-alanine-endopeptidase [Sulfurovum sp.]